MGRALFVQPKAVRLLSQKPKGGNGNKRLIKQRGQVMTKGGSPIKAWFSSTHGGYILASGEIGWSNTDWTKHANDFDGST